MCTYFCQLSGEQFTHFLFNYTSIWLCVVRHIDPTTCMYIYMYTSLHLATSYLIPGISCTMCVIPKLAGRVPTGSAPVYLLAQPTCTYMTYIHVHVYRCMFVYTKTVNFNRAEFQWNLTRILPSHSVNSHRVVHGN